MVRGKLDLNTCSVELPGGRTCYDVAKWRIHDPRDHFVITSFISGWQKRTNAISCCVYGQRYYVVYIIYGMGVREKE